MSEKTDADFIAECEATFRTTSFQGIPLKLEGGSGEMMREALERLKRANEEKEDIQRAVLDHSPEATHLVAKHMIVATVREEGLEQQIAELKALLRWLVSELKADPGDNTWHWLDDEKKARIEEILKP